MPLRPLRELQETRVATREESGVLGFPSRRGLTPRGTGKHGVGVGRARGRLLALEQEGPGVLGSAAPSLLPGPKTPSSFLWKEKLK